MSNQLGRFELIGCYVFASLVLVCIYTSGAFLLLADILKIRSLQTPRPKLSPVSGIDHTSVTRRTSW